MALFNPIADIDVDAGSFADRINPNATTIVLSDGKIATFWQQSDSGSGGSILGQYYDAAGNKIGDQFVVNRDDRGPQQEPSAAALEGGGYVVVWSTLEGNDDVRGRVFDNDGAVVRDEFRVNDEQRDASYDAQVAALRFGGFAVVWTDKDGGDLGLRTRGFSHYGQPETGDRTVNSNTGGDQYDAEIAGLADGGYLITWSDKSGARDPSDVGVEAQRYNGSHGSVGGEFGINVATDGQQDASDVAGGLLDSFDDGFLAVYESGNKVFARANEGAEFEVTAADKDGYSPAVVTLSGGLKAVVWIEGGSNAVLARLYAADGTAIGGPEQIAGGSTFGRDFLTLAATKDNKLIVSYDDQVDGVHDVRSAILQIDLTVQEGFANLDSLFADDRGGVLFGRGGGDYLYGGDGTDWLFGGDGDDYLSSSYSQPDHLDGGDGFDEAYLSLFNRRQDLHLDLTNPAILQDLGDGTTLVSVEAVRLYAGFGNDVLTGGALADRLDGAGGSDTLNGGGGADELDGSYGADTLTGGDGSDSYYVDDAGDRVFEAAGGGDDTVFTSVSYGLAAGQSIEVLRAKFGNSAIDLTGNELAQTLRGNDGDNTLDGRDGDDTLDGAGRGTDRLIGGAGNDIYYVYDSGDQVSEAANGGFDSVRAGANYTLAAGLSVEVLATGNDSGVAVINLSGNELAQTLRGNNGDNTLDGKGGADTLQGNRGNDTYIVDNLGDSVTELAGEGTDTVRSSVSFTLAAELENLTLTGTGGLNGTGNALANNLVGTAGNNRLDGQGGADALRGGLGNEIYVVDNAGDRVIEGAGQGNDAVQSSVTFTLAANVENLTLIGRSDLGGTGNALANNLVGNVGNNGLDGQGGADTLRGGLGNDTYIVDNAGDQVIELARQGIDTVRSSLTLTLAVEVENLTLIGSGDLGGTGNALANTLIGTAGNNRLDGRGGADTLRGGLGIDTYIVDNSGDNVIEGADQGTDTVISSATFTLGANVERLTVTGSSAINGTGNTLANTLTGNGAANQLAGLAGRDALMGGAGADTFVFKALADSTVATSGRDLIQDFSQSQHDRIDLRLIDANTALAGDQGFSFIGAAGFHRKAGELQAVASGADTLVSGDVNGDGRADFAILLDGRITLQGGDFLL